MNSLKGSNFILILMWIVEELAAYYAEQPEALIFRLLSLNILLVYSRRKKGAGEFP